MIDAIYIIFSVVMVVMFAVFLFVVVLLLFLLLCCFGFVIYIIGCFFFVTENSLRRVLYYALWQALFSTQSFAVGKKRTCPVVQI